MRTNVLLAVDDKPDNLHVLRSLIAEHLPNCKLLTALTAEEGFRIAAENDLDGILADVQMPEMSGIEMCRRLKSSEATAHVPLILITAHHTSTEIKAEGLQAGADDFLTKPIDSTELVAKIRVMLRIKHAQDELRDMNEHLDQLVEERTKSLQESNEAVERLLIQQVAINELSSALGEELDLDSIYHTIYEHVSRIMDTQAFVVSFYERETNLIRAGYVIHEGQELDIEGFPPIPLEEEGHGTQSQVIRTGMPLYLPDYDMARMKIEPRTAYDVTISDEGAKIAQASQGKGRSSPNKSVLYVPMKNRGTVIGVLQVQSLKVEAYSKEDEELLAGLANVAAIAIQNSRLNAKVLADAAELRAAFKGTTEALAHVSEIRDPYTAGHQMRVAKLASAIARELRLPAETLELIQISATVHDIGKLAIPTETLSKPSTLSEVEYRLIQDHVQVAYDILKRIDCPWPVADIVLQHHERLDGSGYPNNLRGDEILLEAKIIAVADVVEAMSSHRPYRAALGTDAALEEIKSKKGSHYDSDVVDACLRLFDAGFSFSDTGAA